MSGRVKFKVSLKELSFEYEGDREHGQVLQDRIANTLGSLSAVQADVIDISPARQLTAAPPALPQRRRRRMRKAAGAGAEASSNGDAAAEAVLDGSSRKRKTQGTSYKAQVNTLLDEGFFTQKRTTEVVHAELVRRGHNFAPGRITQALVSLTQKQRLSRTANAAGDWEYEVPRS